MDYNPDSNFAPWRQELAYNYKLYKIIPANLEDALTISVLSVYLAMKIYS